ncbi:universal stress protein [Deinococcus detaillensis]|uniref:Universal stress protein n=1 Tax=Deinococcus detaillensis TaxID=2592048 RepID=A0A553V582_9DEIO|nr:universal stress protein [Deinococcus detaillensis]TSA87615.1 universal stress protein [Deinococcus detaillensis]
MPNNDSDQATSQSYHRILVATGGAAHSQKAVERAIGLAQQFGAVLDVVVVVPTQRGVMASMAAGIPGSGEMEEQIAQSLHDVREAHLKAVVARAEQAGLTVHPHLRSAARAADVILDMAAETGADLIVLGRRHTTALSANLAGSVGLSVSRAALVDVLITH